MRALTLGVVAAAIVGWSEFAAWRGSREAVPPGRLDPRQNEPGEAVLVLGFRSSGRRGRRGRANVVQRWRARIAVRSTDPRAARFVFTGAATHGGVSEAALMAGYAVRELGVPSGNVVLEEQARTTWENIAYSIPLVADVPAIKIASNTFHARKARGYLSQQAPELAARLRRARDYVPGELAPVKPLLGLYEWVMTGRRPRLPEVSVAGASVEP